MVFKYGPPLDQATQYPILCTQILPTPLTPQMTTQLTGRDRVVADRRQLCTYMEIQVIGALLNGESSNIVDLLLPRHFSDKSAFPSLRKVVPSHRMIWLHMLKLWPSRSIDVINLVVSLSTEDAASTNEWNDYLNRCKTKHCRNVNTQHALGLIQLSTQLSLYDALNQIRHSMLKDQKPQEAVLVCELLDFVIDPLRDFFAMVDDLTAYLDLHSFNQQVKETVLQIINGVDEMVYQIHRMAGYRTCVIHLLGYINSSLATDADVVKHLAALTKQALSISGLPQSTIDQIKAIKIDG